MLGKEIEHPGYGTGTVVAEDDNSYRVAFSHPPGMNNNPGPHIYPVITFAKEKAA